LGIGAPEKSMRASAARRQAVPIAASDAIRSDGLPRVFSRPKLRIRSQIGRNVELTAPGIRWVDLSNARQIALHIDDRGAAHGAFVIVRGERRGAMQRSDGKIHGAFPPAVVLQ
jgi:hypothetical protein